MDYGDHLRELQRTAPDLADEVASFRGLGAVMNWMTQRGIPLSSVEILQQDEFSLDFLLPLPQGGVLVFGIT